MFREPYILYVSCVFCVATSASAVDVLEMKSKLVVAEKTNKRMQVDLTCLEREMGAKVKVDGVKNQLIDMQERKIGQQAEEVGLSVHWPKFLSTVDTYGTSFNSQEYKRNACAC